MSGNGTSANASGPRVPGITSESLMGPHRTLSADADAGGANAHIRGVSNPNFYVPGITSETLTGPYEPNLDPPGMPVATIVPFAPGITSESFNGPQGPDSYQAAAAEAQAQTAGYQMTPGK